MPTLKVWDGSQFHEIKGDKGDPGEVTTAELESRVSPIETRVETVEVDTAEAGTRATRADTRVFDVRAYGAVGDGVTNDTAALQACADDARDGGGEFFLPKGMNCLISDTLNLRYVQDVTIRGRITVAHSEGPGVVVGNRSTGAIPTSAYIAEVIYASWPITQTNPLIRVVGAKLGVFNLVSCRYVQLYANHAVADDDSVAYNSFYLGFIRKLELFGEPGGQSWINENTFYNGRFFTLELTAADYTHNHNRFVRPTLEAGASITFNTGAYNVLEGVRGEGTSNTVFFGPGTYRNTIEQSWASNQFTLHTNLLVTDEGIGNQVFNIKQRDASFRTIMRIDSASLTTDTTSEWPTPHATRRILPGFRKLTALNALTDYYDSGLIPVESSPQGKHEEGGATLRDLWWRSDAAIWRPKVFVYDAGRQPLDGSSTQYMFTSGGWQWHVNGYYMPTSSRAAGRICLPHPDVAYIRVTAHTGAAGSFDYWELLGYVPVPSGDQLIDFARRQSARPLMQITTNMPSKSLLPRGTQIATNSGIYIVSARVDTSMAAAAAGGATDITVSSGTGINGGAGDAGDRIAILLTDNTTHLTTVEAVSGNTVTLADALPSAAGVGRQVATNRLRHIT